MNPHWLSSIRQLTDAELLTQMNRLVRCEREAVAELIGHLAELEARDLHLELGYSSLYEYCIQVLHLSEHEAYARIYTARTARTFPVIFEMLASGAVCLTTIRLLAAVLTPENHRQLLDAARHQSRRQVEELVARIRPQSDVPTSIRKLPAEKLMLSPPMASLDTRASEALGSDISGGTEALPGGFVTAVQPVARPAVIAPLAPDRYKVQFTASAETHEKLRHLQELLRHQIHDGDPAAIIDQALGLLLEHIEKQKLGLTARPRKSRGTSPGSRNIPAEVRRVVWKRDGGRCAFVGREGHRCGERKFSEFHHVDPHGVGGPPTVENVEVRCRAHNQYEEELYFGSRKPRRRKERRQVEMRRGPRPPSEVRQGDALEVEVSLEPCATPRMPEGCTAANDSG